MRAVWLAGVDNRLDHEPYLDVRAASPMTSWAAVLHRAKSTLACSRMHVFRSCTSTYIDAFKKYQKIGMLKNPAAQMLIYPSTDGKQPVNCLIDPCLTAKCPNHPDAVCEANYCGGCFADFFDSNGKKAGLYRTSFWMAVKDSKEKSVPFCTLIKNGQGD
uniref:Uncharacterized protein n=1 Tax=Romanomermis culicivorax TaxID=13658 RepID=A0A915JPG5_ROMCU